MSKITITQKYLFATFLAFLLIIQAAIADVTTDTQVIKSAHWETHKIARGIILKQALFPKLFGESQSVNLLEVDLNRNKIKISIAADPAQRILTSTFAKENSAVAAINGTFFDMKNGGSWMLIRQNGKTINPTKTYSERSNGAFTIDGHHLNIVTADSTEADWADKLKAPNVMVSGPILLMDGKPATLSKGGFNVLTHPRSAVAITNDTSYCSSPWMDAAKPAAA